MFSFFKTPDERRSRISKSIAVENDGEDFFRSVVETVEQKAAREYYEKYLSDLEQSCKYNYYTIHSFIIIASLQTMFT